MVGMENIRNRKKKPKNRFFVFGTIFELSLVIVAWFLAELVDPDVLPISLAIDREGLKLTFLYLIPLLAFAILFYSKPVERLSPFREMIRKIKTTLGRHFKKMTPLQIIVLSCAAGFGEEILFRGILQPMTDIFFASLIFGMLHSVNLHYFFIATLMGYYFGHVYETTGTLMIPILLHSIYDIVALFLLKRKLTAENRSRLDAADLARSR